MKNNTQKIVTIFGGTGFLGRYVVKALASQGYGVRVVARGASTILTLRTMGEVGQIGLVSGDITKPETYKAALTGSYAVINLVGILYETGKQKFATIQTEGAANLAKYAKEAGVKRFIQLSALGVDKAKDAKYASSKLAGEQGVKQAFPEAVILRPSILFGAEDNFFNQFAKMASLSPALPLIGGGKTRFQPVYVVDVAKAISTILDSETINSEIFELGGTDSYSFRQILEYICKITNRHPCLLPIPFGIAGLIGLVSQHAPNPKITADQVKLLHYDNVVSGNTKTFADLGIVPESLENIVPHYLARYAKPVA